MNDYEFNEASFTEMCHQARDVARAEGKGEDEDALAWALLVIVRKAVEWPKEDDGLLPGATVVWHIEDLVYRHSKNTRFRIRQTMDRELFRLHQPGA